MRFCCKGTFRKQRLRRRLKYMLPPTMLLMTNFPWPRLPHRKALARRQGIITYEHIHAHAHTTRPYTPHYSSRTSLRASRACYECSKSGYKHSLVACDLCKLLFCTICWGGDDEQCQYCISKPSIKKPRPTIEGSLV